MPKVPKESEEQYEVERLVKHRISKKRCGKAEYDYIEIQVKWEGYAPSYNTWEPLYQIYKDVKILCTNYFKERGLEVKCKLNCDYNCRRQITATDASLQLGQSSGGQATQTASACQSEATRPPNGL